eukprot:TRINITY_DN25081_c0_g1_i1.p1 TRINITY_DN25081_c0_g1~~TRINITY_DN25081_c0_g1_i1.p1  ORF type:complete len:564 (-),score=125.20 TRINITY_DN25081_c0_g1_i1:54-1694(-)
MAESERLPDPPGPPVALKPTEPSEQAVEPKKDGDADEGDLPEVDFSALRAKVAAPKAAEAAAADDEPEFDFAALRAKMASPKPATAEPEAPRPYFSLCADSTSMQGRRPKQEDRHVKILDLTKAAKALKMPIDHLEQPCAFFSVYDGHQGHQCSEFVAKNFHVKLLKKLSADTDAAKWTEERIGSVFKEICEELDAEFLSKFRTALDGTTLVVALITGTRLFTAWVGDSRLVLCQRATHDQILAHAMTQDHRPHLEAEAKRVIDAGGIVVDFGMGLCRVAHDGYEEKMREMRRSQALGLGIVTKEPVALAVSRALGDREFKAVTGKALLVPTPDVRCIQLERSHMFMAIMCDGITDVMTEQEVCEELNLNRPGPPDPVKRCRMACGALVQEAYKRGSEDNLTVILVRFQWRDGFEEAPLPSDHPVAIALAEAEKHAAKGDSAAVASKKRRLAAAASVSSQKVAAYERALAQEEAEQAMPKAKAPRPAEKAPEAVKAVEKAALNGSSDSAGTSKDPPTKEAPEEKKEEATAGKADDEEGDDDGMTFL